MEQKQLTLVTCKMCGWVHMSIPLENALENVNSFNTYYDTLSSKEQQDYYGGHKSSMNHYTRCFFCGGPYTNFRDFRKGDCPDGVTIGPILERDAKFGEGHD